MVNRKQLSMDADDAARYVLENLKKDGEAAVEVGKMDEFKPFRASEGVSLRDYLKEHYVGELGNDSEDKVGASAQRVLEDGLLELCETSDFNMQGMKIRGKGGNERYIIFLNNPHFARATD